FAVDVGTTANKIVQLDGSARLPAVDGSQLQNLPAPTGIGNAQISTTAAIAWSKISKTGATASDVGAAASTTTITAGTGLTGGGDLRANRTIAVDVGTTANKIVQLDASGRLPAVNASLLTNVPLTSRWSANGSKIYYNTANVGIGTNDPAS